MATVIPESKGEQVLFWTHWHERGWEKGLEQGKQEGIQEGESRLAARFLRSNWRGRFGAGIPDAIATAARSMDPERLTEFAGAVLDFESPADAEAWLARHTAR